MVVGAAELRVWMHWRLRVQCPSSLQDCQIRQRTGAEAVCTRQRMEAPVPLDPDHGHSRILQAPVLRLYRGPRRPLRRRRSATVGGAPPHNWRPLRRPCRQLRKMTSGDGCGDDGEAAQTHVTASWRSIAHDRYMDIHKHASRICIQHLRISLQSVC